jgi:hypothetical protein
MTACDEHATDDPKTAPDAPSEAAYLGGREKCIWTKVTIPCCLRPEEGARAGRAPRPMLLLTT